MYLWTCTFDTARNKHHAQLKWTKYAGDTQFQCLVVTRGGRYHGDTVLASVYVTLQSATNSSAGNFHKHPKAQTSQNERWTPSEGLINKTGGSWGETKHPTLRPLNLVWMCLLSSDEVRCSLMLKSQICPGNNHNTQELAGMWTWRQDASINRYF